MQALKANCLKLVFILQNGIPENIYIKNKWNIHYFLTVYQLCKKI